MRVKFDEVKLYIRASKAGSVYCRKRKHHKVFKLLLKLYTLNRVFQQKMKWRILKKSRMGAKNRKILTRSGQFAQVIFMFDIFSTKLKLQTTKARSEQNIDYKDPRKKLEETYSQKVAIKQSSPNFRDNFEKKKQNIRYE